MLPLSPILYLAPASEIWLHLDDVQLRTDTVRARVATGLFERIAEWNGYGRALYPWACGVDAVQSQASDLSTTASLLCQAQFLGIRTNLFVAPAEQLTLEDLDRSELSCDGNNRDNKYSPRLSASLSHAKLHPAATS